MNLLQFLLYGHDDPVARRYTAFCADPTRGVPGQWVEADWRRFLAISDAELARQYAVNALTHRVAELATTTCAGATGAAALARCLRREVADIDDAVAALPAVDVAGLSWVLDEHERAARNGTLVPPLR